MKNKEEKKNRIWVPIVIGALACSAAVGTGIALVHNQQRPKAGTVATMSDAADFSGLTTEVAEVTTEEATTEAVIEAAVSGNEKPEAVPATTEIGGGKKKAEEITEEKKPSTTESTKPSTNHSNNSGSASSGQSTTPKPSNNGSNSGGNSGNSNSSGNNSSSSGNNNFNNGGSSNSGSSNSDNNTPQHQHNYNVWVKTKDAYDEKVIDQAAYDETIEHPEEGYWADAVKCHICGQVFTSMDTLRAHADHGAESWGTTDDVWVKTKDAWTETKHHDAVIHTVHHDEEGYWKCECGARK